MQNSNDEASRNGESVKTLVIFSVFGFLSCISYSTILSSTEDLLANLRSPPSSSIWISILFPAEILMFTLPYVFDRVPTLVFALAPFPLVLGILCCILLSVSNVWLICLGVGMFGVVDAIVTVTGVCLTANFEKSTVKAMCLGSGFGYIFGPIYYTVITSWIHVNCTIAISIILIMQSCIFFANYLLLENRQETVQMGYRTIADQQPKKDEETNLQMACINSRAVIEDKFDGQDKNVCEKAFDKVEHSTKNNDNATTNSGKRLTTKEKLYHVIKVLPEITQIIISYVTLNFALTGVITSIAFLSSPFPPSDHYKYYSIVSFAGIFVSRTYLGWADIIKPGLADKILIRRTWILVVISVSQTVFFIFASLYRFLPGVWVPLALIFTLGFSSDAVFVNMIVAIKEFQDLGVHEVIYGMMTFAIYFGALLGTALAPVVETLLVKHCLMYTNNSATCFTRKIDLNDTLLAYRSSF